MTKEQKMEILFCHNADLLVLPLMAHWNNDETHI